MAKNQHAKARNANTAPAGPADRQRAFLTLAAWLATSRALLLELRNSAHDIAVQVKHDLRSDLGQMLGLSGAEELEAFAGDLSDTDSRLANIVLMTNGALPDPLASAGTEGA
jgi:hypothetical protein